MKIALDFLKVVIFVLILYSPVFLFLTTREFKQIEEQANLAKKRKYDEIKFEIKKLLEQDRFLESCQRLSAEQRVGSLVTYSIDGAEGRCAFPENVELPQLAQKDQLEAIKVGGDFLFYSQHKTRESAWTISYSPVIIGFFTGFKGEYSKILIQSIFTTFLNVIYIVFMFGFLAVLILSKSIQNKFRKNGNDPIWLKVLNKIFGWLQLQDLKTLQFVASASLKRSELMQKDQDLLETSLEHSILNEIKKNNQIIPYTFRGTVAKVDINGFSKVVSSGNTQISHDLTKILEDSGCELLLRYKGLFEKTVGDEIVVVFKTGDSALLATAFARDLMREFSSLYFVFGSEKRRFTLKSSISSSDLTFSKRAPGYGFLGSALTYTTRLLDVVLIKDRNILSCLKSQVFEVKSLVKIPAELRSFEFKNMTAGEGYLIDQFVTIDEVYDNQMTLIKYFRSNEALIFLLNKVKIESDFEKLNQIFTTFCDISTQVTSSELIQTWIETIKIFEKRVLQDPTLTFSFSRLIIEGSRLIPSKQWDARCTEAIISISRFIEGRINASIVDVLIEKDLNNIALEQEKSFLLEDDQSYRTRGNLLINQAILKLTDSIFEKIIKMTNSNNPLESSTGIYCACRVIIHYQKLNPAELETFMSYRKLSKILNHHYVNNNKDISERLLKLIDQVNGFNELTYKEPIL